MKVLIVAPFPTDPLDAGNRARVANLIDALRTLGHDVHFAHLQTTSFDGEAMARRLGAGKLHLLPFSAQPPTLPRPRRYARRIAAWLKRPRAFEWSLDAWYWSGYTPMLGALQATFRFDAVVVNYVFMTRAFDAFPVPCLKLLDTHDSLGLRHLRYLQAGMRPHWFSTPLADEVRGLRRADVVIAIQDEEAATFRRRLGEGEIPKVVTVGHLVALPPLKPMSARRSAVFLGSSNPINVHGLRNYLRYIHPRVMAALPDFQLLIAGAASDHLADAPGLIRLGVVPDLASAFEGARICINPVLMGTGIAIKLLDAMAHGIPCVCTRSGSRGLHEADGGIDVVDDHDSAGFAERMVRLLTDLDCWSSHRRIIRAAAERWNATQESTLNTALAVPAHSTAQKSLGTDARNLL